MRRSERAESFADVDTSLRFTSCQARSLEAAAKADSVGYRLFRVSPCECCPASARLTLDPNLPSPGGRADGRKTDNFRGLASCQGEPGHKSGPIFNVSVNRPAVFGNILWTKDLRRRMSAAVPAEPALFVRVRNTLGDDFAHDLSLRSGISVRSFSMLAIKRVCKSRCSGLP
jgi:hypothetical protein